MCQIVINKVNVGITLFNVFDAKVMKLNNSYDKV